MKSKEWLQIKSLTKEELLVKLESLKKHLFDLKFKNATTKLKNPLEIRTTRRLIARINTLLRLKENLRNENEKEKRHNR